MFDAAVVGVIGHAATAVLVVTRPAWPIEGALLAVLGVTFGFGASTVLHHGGHLRFSSNPTLNAAVVHAAVPIGLWVWFWGAKHRIHHRVPAAYPDDTYTSATTAVRLHPMAPLRSYHRYQPYYIVVLYMLYVLVDLLAQVRFVLLGQIKYAAWSPPWPLRLQRFIIEKLMVALVLAPYAAISWQRLLITYAIALVLAGMLAALLVGIGHINRGLDLRGEPSPDWRIQVLDSTLSFSPYSRLIGWVTGGLNLHAAHHLRPRASRDELRADHAALAREHGARLRETPNLLTAIHGHFAALRAWGRGPAA